MKRCRFRSSVDEKVETMWLGIQLPEPGAQRRSESRRVRPRRSTSLSRNGTADSRFLLTQAGLVWAFFIICNPLAPFVVERLFLGRGFAADAGVVFRVLLQFAALPIVGSPPRRHSEQTVKSVQPSA